MNSYERMVVTHYINICCVFFFIAVQVQYIIVCFLRSVVVCNVRRQTCASQLLIFIYHNFGSSTACSNVAYVTRGVITARNSVNSSTSSRENLFQTVEFRL